MKVAQILYSGLGGHGSVAFSLLDADVYGEWQNVLGFVGVEPLLSAYRDQCLRRGINFAYFGAPPSRPWRTWGSLYRWLRNARPDAVILHSPPSLLPALAYALVSGVGPVVVEHQPNALKRPSDWVFGAAAMVLAKRVVVLSPGYRRELRGALSWCFKDAKVVTIPNGIDTRKFRPTEQAPRARLEIRLGMAARFTHAKRQDVLLDVLQELLQLRPDLEWHLDLAGDGETWSNVAAKARAKNLDGRVTLLGILDEDGLAVWLRSLDIYLHATAGETLSTSILQAMACQLPIVSSDVAGVRELIGNDPACGLLVAHQDPRGFARAVLELIDDRAAAKALARAAREYSISVYANELMFSRYRGLLNDISATRSARIGA
jgi:glycosyltransferase involved in cell wall biosynthesis